MKLQLPAGGHRRTLAIVAAAIWLYLALTGCAVLEQLAGVELERNLADAVAEYVREICALERPDRNALLGELNDVVEPHQLSIRCAKASAP